MGSGNIERRLERLEAKQAISRVAWTLEDGTEVSFSIFQMLDAHFALMRRSAAALAGDPLSPLEGPLAALLNTTEEERARVAKQLPWVGHFAFELERQANPSEEEIRAFRGEWAHD